METLLHIDWKSVFVPSTSIAEIFVRGTLVYLFLFVLLRIMRREGGSLGIADVLVIVLIADAAQNAMASEYKSVTEGAILVLTIAGWDFFLDWLGYKWSWFQRLLRPAPLLLVKNGRMLRRNMRQEMVTPDELMAQLRQQGVEKVEEVKKCYLEGDGQVSVITNDSDKPRKNKPKVAGG